MLNGLRELYYKLKNNNRLLLFLLFFFYFATVLFYLFLVFSPAILVPFSYHDNNYFLIQANAPKMINTYPLYNLLLNVGRPAAALIGGVINICVNNISDLNLIRSVIIFLLAVTITFFAMLVYRLFRNKIVVFIISTTIFTLPAIQFNVFYCDAYVIIAIFFALLSWFFIQKVEPKHYFSRNLLSHLFFSLLALGSFIISAFCYPVNAAFFLVPTLATVLFTNIYFWPQTRLKVIRDLVFFGFGSLCYFVLIKLLFVPGLNQVDTYKFSLTTNPMLKIVLLKDITFYAFNLWNIYPIYSNKTIFHMPLTVIFAGAILAGIRTFSTSRDSAERLKYIRFSIQILAAIAILLLASNAANLAASGGMLVFHTIFVNMAMIVLLLVWSFNSLKWLFPYRFRETVVMTVICFMFVGATFIASYNILYNVLNSYLELNFVRTQIAKHINEDKKISRIHVVRPKFNTRGFNNRFHSCGEEFNVNTTQHWQDVPAGYLGDEFNVNTTQYWQDVPWFILGTLLEFKPKDRIPIYPCSNEKQAINSAPSGHIVITQGAFNEEPAAVSPDTIIINMNDLVWGDAKEKAEKQNYSFVAGEPVKTAVSADEPRLMQEGYRGFNIIYCKGRFYGLAQDEGGFDINKVDRKEYKRCVEGASIDEVKKLIDQVVD